MQDYIKTMLGQFSDDDAEYVETIDVTIGTTKIPFPLVRVTIDDKNDYFYAETMANGTVMAFYFYYLEDNAGYLTDADLEVFESILSTFTPVQ